MAHTVGPASTDGPGAPVRRGIVSRQELFQRLAEAGRVVHLSAPAGSGKTILLRSWLAEAGLDASAAWVSVGAEQRDPQRFWISVSDALRGTNAGSTLVKALTAAPGLDGWAIVESLLSDVGRLEDRVWLVIDDLQELRADETLRQLELLVMRAPANLRFVLATRHDMRMGLHRVRLEGELTEIRAADLRFAPADAARLFEAAGVRVSDAAVQKLVERTEGWAAGLRLAALSLRGRADPDRFAAEFSGTERTVAEYLLAEVLERQPADVRRLLLRTSVLERVSGPLADVMTGGSGGERMLQELEEANAFVVSLDSGRSWFRYHRLFSELLQLELRRTEPDGLRDLHLAAAEWLEAHGYRVEAIQHLQAAESWERAARLLYDNSLTMQLEGLGETTHELFGRFPPAAASDGRELAILAASDEILHGSATKAEALLNAATRAVEAVDQDRERFEVSLTILRVVLATRTGNLPAVVEQADRLLSPAGSRDGGADDLRAVALTSLGIAELWLNRVDVADRHLEEAVSLAHRRGRPYLEITAMAHWAMLARIESFPLAIRRGLQAADLAKRHGWSEASIMYPAYVALGVSNVSQGSFEEGERWLELAERMIRAEGEPAIGMTLYIARGLLEGSRGRFSEALAAFRAAERQAQAVVTTHTLGPQARSLSLHLLVRMGRTKEVEEALAAMSEDERRLGDVQIVVAALSLAKGDAEAALAELRPVVEGSAVTTNRFRLIDALVLFAISQDAAGDADGAGQTVERVLDLVEPDRAIVALLLNPAPALLERHARRTAHGALLSEILTLMAGKKPPPAQDGAPLLEALSQSETRILRYLPTNLSVPEIADQTYLSANTVKTHMRHLYGKLGAHNRGQAVMRARVLGLLAPPAFKGTSRSA